MKTVTRKPKQEKPYVLTVKLSPQFGRDLRAFAHRHDTTMSHVVKNSVRRTIHDGVITLEPELKPSPWLQRRIAKVRADATAGRNIAGPFTTANELSDYLQSL